MNQGTDSVGRQKKSTHSPILKMLRRNSRGIPVLLGRYAEELSHTVAEGYVHLGVEHALPNLTNEEEGLRNGSASNPPAFLAFSMKSSPEVLNDYDQEAVNFCWRNMLSQRRNYSSSSPTNEDEPGCHPGQQRPWARKEWKNQQTPRLSGPRDLYHR